MPGFLRTLGWFALPGLLVGCGKDGASVNVPTEGEAIAAGALFPLSVSDDCQGGGKLNFCTTEALVSIDSFSSEKESVAKLLLMKDLNEGLQTSAQLVVDAKAPGSTALQISATFDDGSLRTFDGNVTVKKANSMTVSHSCSTDAPDDLDLFPVGAEIALSVKLFDGKAQLKGEHQRDLLEGEGVARTRGYLQSNNYVWSAPEAGEHALSSPVFGRFATTYRSYDLASVSIDAVTRKYEGPTRYQSFVAFDAQLSVDGALPCQLPPVRIDVLTPKVCDGRDGVTTWITEDPAYGVAVRALDSGTCEFTVTVDGTETAFPVQAELAATDVPTPVADPCDGVVCDEAPTSCEEGSELAKDACCVVCAPVPDPAECEIERVAWDELYASQLADAQACNVDADCSPVVLVGGCRNYCYVALNVDQTATFMNAISEKYYTSCRACLVDNALNACEGDGRTHCKSGVCSMLKP
jgi:hypothetical protein